MKDGWALDAHGMGITSDLYIPTAGLFLVDFSSFLIRLSLVEITSVSSYTIMSMYTQNYLIPITNVRK